MTRKPPRDPPTEAGIKGPTSRAFARIGGVGLVACMHRGGDYGRARHTRLPLHTLLFQRASSNKSGDDSISIRSCRGDPRSEPPPTQRFDWSVLGERGGQIKVARLEGSVSICCVGCASVVFGVAGGWWSATKQERGREVSAALASGGRALSEAAP